MSRALNGTSDLLSRTSAILTAAPVTMACWFKTPGVQTFPVLMCLGSNANGTDHFLMGLVSGVVQVSAKTNGDPARTADSTTTRTTNIWQHACVVHASSTDRRAFLNGGGKGTDTTASTPTQLDRTSVGAQVRATTDSWFDGDIAECAIWNIALSDAEVALLATGVYPNTVQPGNLVAYWPLGGVASPETDLISGNNLTLTGTSAGSTHPPMVASGSMLLVF